MRLSAPARRGARIEMVPLIDVVFLLLVFFTYAMLSMIVPRGVKVRLPAVGGAEGAAREPVAVTIGRGGELWVDREPVEIEALVGRVKACLDARAGGGPDAWVLVHGDARAPLESALDVLARLRDGGIEKVTFRTAGRKTGADPEAKP
jgi:biopolymer transport protein ExbD